MMHLGEKKSITWVLEFNYDGLTGLHIYVNAASKKISLMEMDHNLQES